MRTGFRFLSLIFCTAVLISCGSDTPVEEESDEVVDEVSEKVSDVQKIATQNIFNSVPAPDEVADLVSRSGAEYDPLILNNPDNYDKYTSEDYKAISLGVYGTDLSYTSVFEQTQESMLFLKCVNQTCKSLGISGVFDEKTFDRIEANKENKDSLLQIISKSFWQADAFLKENQRAHTSTLMIAGGWVEGIYLAVNIAKASPDKKIRKKIAEQKSSLKDLITLLENSKVSADVAFLLEDLKLLLPAFEVTVTEEVKKDPKEVKKDPKEVSPDDDAFI